ncbi:hypothetical protein KSP39_PZI003301 [Platanthera zijinensis]|uniref:Retrovirus-related Pol polyprotein from transposon TNT 1-94-like beta-barrel domain-containing protein n=1 Tax=Platanthera zijinensis TaxID=2320716 RepID=A0AAP0BV40_9ASPA
MVVDISDPKSFVAMIGSSHRSASSEWWLDSGATCHVTNDRGLLSNVTTVKDRVENCNGGATDVTYAGTAELVLSSGAAANGGAPAGWDPEEDDLLDDDV